MGIAHREETPEIREEAREFLRNHKKMVLSVLDIEKHPNASLVLYTSDDFTIYFGTLRSFGKYSALTADPHIALAIVQEGIDPLQVLDMQGVVEEITEEETRVTLNWFVLQNTAKYYVKDAEDFVMFKIKPTHIRWLDATSGDLQICDLTPKSNLE